MKIDSTFNPVKDRQTVTPEGECLQELIRGVVLHRLRPIEDERGEITEVYRPSWGIHPDPLVYVYQVVVRPGIHKGWVVHKKQDDRIFVSRGVLRWALYDARPESPTFRTLNHLVISERNRSLLIIPSGVFHAVQNISSEDAFFINMPTKHYDHRDPDKYRFPMDGKVISFTFDRNSHEGG